MPAYTITTDWQKVASAGQAVLVQNLSVAPVLLMTAANGPPADEDGVQLSTSHPSEQIALAADLYARCPTGKAKLEVMGGISLAGAGTTSTGSTSAAVPSNTAIPAVTGAAEVNKTLTASTGTWSGSPTSYTYAWRRNATVISGATGKTYVAVAADVGATLSVAVTAINATGPSSSAAVSAATAAIAAVLGPTSATFTAGAAAGAAIAAITGLSAGETVTSVAPNDGRVAIAGSGTTLVAGATTSSAGEIDYTVTTSTGRTLAIAVTATLPVRVVQKNQTVQVGSFVGTAQRTADTTKTYPLQVIGAEPVIASSGSEVRFEVQGTDNDAQFDPQDGTKNRSELVFPANIPFYSTFTADFEFKIEGNGTVTDRQWLIPFQIHGDDALGTSPVFALDIQPNAAKTGEIIRVDANNGPDKAHPTYRQFNAAANTAGSTRDAWHRAQIVFVPDKNEGVGRIKVVFDGTTLLDLSNVSTGFPDATANPYAKIGLYAGKPTQTGDTGLVSHVRNVAFSVTAAAAPAATTFDSAASTFDSSTLTFDKAA